MSTQAESPSSKDLSRVPLKVSDGDDTSGSNPPRSRANSQSSLNNTMEFYQVNRSRPSAETTDRRIPSTAALPSAAPPSSSVAPAASSSSAPTTASPNTYQAHSASILPSAAFYKPTKPMGVRSTLLAAHQQSASISSSLNTPIGSLAEQQPAAITRPTSPSSPPPRNNWRTSMMGVSGEEEPAFSTASPGRRVGHGPLITRITSSASPSAPGTAFSAEGITGGPLHARSASTATGNSFIAPMMRRASSEMSQEDVQADLAQGARSAVRLGQIGRSSSEEAIQRWSHGQVRSPTPPHGVGMARAPSEERQHARHGSFRAASSTAGRTVGQTVIVTASREELGIRDSSSDAGAHVGQVGIEMSIIGGSTTMSRGNSARSGNGAKSPPPPSMSAGEWNHTYATRVGLPTEGAPDLTDFDHAKAEFVSIPTKPVLDGSGRPVRNYQLHKGTNRFFLGGRLLSSGDNPWPFLISFALAIVMPILFIVFSAPVLWQQLGRGGKVSIFIFIYLAAIMWVNMAKTAWADPGIIPRDLDPTPERKWVDDLNGEGEGGWRAEPRFLRINEGVIATKWCETCQTYRPPRTSHCRLCDNCVEHTDHHCTFLNNCIGRRNYSPFFAFLISAILCAIWAICFSAWHIARRHDLARDPTNSAFGKPWAGRWDVVGSFVVVIVAFGLLCPILGLFGYHVRLLWVNRTTIEMLRPKGDRSGAINPVDGSTMGNVYALKSPWSNIVTLLCRPVDVPSWIEPKAIATRDEREEYDPQQS